MLGGFGGRGGAAGGRGMSRGMLILAFIISVVCSYFRQVVAVVALADEVRSITSKISNRANALFIYCKVVIVVALEVRRCFSSTFKSSI